MPPLAPCAVASVHVHVNGSNGPATCQYTAWLRPVTPAPLTSFRTSVQPNGAVTTGAPITSTTATSTSPTATPAGRANTNDVATAFTPDDADRNEIALGEVRIDRKSVV